MSFEIWIRIDAAAQMLSEEPSNKDFCIVYETNNAVYDNLLLFAER